jgi:hypothetical protein
MLVTLLVVAALLVFSAVRVTRPVSLPTAGVSATHFSLTKNAAVMEVGVRVSKIAGPLILQCIEAQISIAAKPITLLIMRQNGLARIWPEHRRTFVRRILPSTVDAAH